MNKEESKEKIEAEDDYFTANICFSSKTSPSRNDFKKTHFVI